MKYKLINFSTKEEHLCDKVTIDGFDYYVNNEIPKENNFATDGLGIFKFHSENPCQAIICNPKKVIATTNPNIDIPKVVDEVEILLRKDFDLEIIDSDVDNIFLNGLTEGYNKSHLEKSLIQRCKIVYLLMKYLNFEKNNNIKLFIIDKFKNMKQIKRVPFDYEYFKANPETKLETKRGKVAYFIGEKKIGDKYPLIFECLSSPIFSTTLNGKLDDNNSLLDIFMLLESKEEVVYGNVHEDYIAGIYDTLEDAIKGHGYGAKSVAKLTIIDGELIKTETVHKY